MAASATALHPVSDTARARLMWLDVALAAAAALCYLLIAAHVLGVGDLQVSERPAPVIYVAAGGYILGGLLILLRRRWLLITGVVINTLVLLMFFSAYADRPAVLFSPGGLASKAAQLLLEVGLIALVVLDWRRGRPAR